jgi:ribosomal protein S17E
VNNKDKDIQDLKADFEKNKKHLEQMVKDIRDKEEAAKKANTL